MPRGKAASSLQLIDACYTILEEIQPATVRAVCYRLFVGGDIASMAKTCTNRVSSQLTYAREEGLIPWEWVVDETREAERVPAWTDPEAYVDVVKRSYRRDRWAQQPRRVEVWSEKGTVRGTLAPVLNEYGVTFRVMHGFASATSLNQVAEESAERRERAGHPLCGRLGPQRPLYERRRYPETPGAVRGDRHSLSSDCPHQRPYPRSGDAVI